MVDTNQDETKELLKDIKRKIAQKKPLSDKDFETLFILGLIDEQTTTDLIGHLDD